MIPLLLTILCSTSIALILKQNAVRKGETIVLLAANYLMAAVVSAAAMLTGEWVFSRETFLFGMGLGLFFVIGFFVFARAVDMAGTALGTLSSRLSVIVPLLLSIIIYNEIPDYSDVTGFILTFATILLFYFSLVRRGRSTAHTGWTEYMYLLAVLVAIGVNDFCMKVFQEWRPVEEKPLFLLCIFGFAFLYSTAYILWRGVRISRRDASRGLILGIPNMFSSFFLLAALDQLPAIVVYPMVNVGIIFLTAVLAGLIWKEVLNGYARLALVSGILAIIFLSL